MNIARGDLFWISPDESNQIASGHIHPYMVVQVDTLTVTVCALTSNLKRAKEPGNVLLEDGEGNLARHSVIVVSQALTVKKEHLGKHIGTLSEARVQQALAGMRFLQSMIRHA